MATEHWCKEHKTQWFKKGRMRAYAHPILDDNGKQLYDDDDNAMWCNEPEVKSTAVAVENTTRNETYKADPQKMHSIEAQNAYTGIPALVEALAKYPNNLLLLTAANYAMSKLSNWISQGGNINPFPDAPESPNKPIDRRTSGNLSREVIEQPIEEQVAELAEQVKEKLDRETVPTNIQQFYNWLQTQGKKYSRTWFLNNSGIDEKTLLNSNGIKAAYDWFKEEYTNKGK